MGRWESHLPAGAAFSMTDMPLPASPWEGFGPRGSAGWVFLLFLLTRRRRLRYLVNCHKWLLWKEWECDYDASHGPRNTNLHRSPLCSLAPRNESHKGNLKSDNLGSRLKEFLKFQGNEAW